MNNEHINLPRNNLLGEETTPFCYHLASEPPIVPYIALNELE